MENTPALGAFPSPFDYRDRVASASVAAQLAAIVLPPTFHTELGPVLNQAKTPSCVSHSAVEKLKLWWFLKTGEWVDFSPRFLDTLAKRYDNCNPATDGTYPRLVFKLLAQFGCATTATVPNDTSFPILEYRNDAILTEAAFAEAAKYKTPGYVQIPKDFQSTRASIFLYGAISTLFQIGREWWTPSWLEKDVSPLRTPNPVVDGHQVTPCGWTDGKLNTLRNEWSESWGRKGEADYDSVAWAPFIIEQWAIAEIPSNVKDFLVNLPAPSSFHYKWGVDLKYGDFSDDVKFAQIALMILGYLAPIPAEELGHFGSKTAAANARYQTANRITPAPNNIGPRTRAALNRDFAI